MCDVKQLKKKKTRSVDVEKVRERTPIGAKDVVTGKPRRSGCRKRMQKLAEYRRNAADEPESVKATFSLSR